MQTLRRAYKIVVSFEARLRRSQFSGAQKGRAQESDFFPEEIGPG